MTDFSHLSAIQERLYRETNRLNSATNEADRKFRVVQVSQAEKELAAEYKFLGITPQEINMTDEELLEALA